MPSDVENYDCKLTDDLASTFDRIAKIALSASATYSDQNSRLSALEKTQRAHSALSLIVEDAVRGLDNAMMSVVGYVVAAITEMDDDKGDMKIIKPS
jgi:hypothetical protein